MTNFDVIHQLDACPAVLLQDVSRGEALELVEERVVTGTLTGRRFYQVALHQYHSYDGRATVVIQPTTALKEPHDVPRL